MLSTENTQLNFFSIKTPRTPTFSNMVVSSPLTPSNLKLQSNIYERLIKEQENVDFIKTLIKLKQKTQNKSNINNNLNIKPKTSIDNIKQSIYIPYQNFNEATTPTSTSSKIIKNVSVDSKESENILTYTVIKKKPKPKLNHKLIFEPYSSKSKKSSKFINNFILQKYNINSSKHSFNNKGNQKEFQIQKNVCLTPRKKDSNNNIFTNIQIKQGNVKSYRESKVPRTVIDLFPPENECKVNGNTNLNNHTNKLNKKHKSASTSNMFHNNTNRNNNKTKKECETIRVRVMTPTEKVKEQLARQNESKQKAKEAALKEKHIRQRNKMVVNHRNRIKKFVLDLVKKPIFIEDVDMPDNKNYNSDDKKYRNQSASPQKFIFNRFLTDKERIKQLELNKKEELQKMSKYKTLSEERKGRKYEQPTMRFKHRTQLERIVDQLNHYNYNEQHNFIVKKQINRLHKNTVKIPKKHKRKINYSYHTLSSDNEDPSFETINCLKLGQLQNKNIKQKELLNFHYLKRKEANISMRELMKDYNFHTYFKTAKQIVDLNQMNQSIDNKEQKRQSYAFSQRSESAKTVKFQVPFYFTKNQKFNLPHYKEKEINEMIPFKGIDKELAKQLFTNKKFITNFTSKYPTSNVTNLDFIKNNPLLYKFSKENESPNSSVISTPKSQEYLYNIMQNPSLFPLQRNKKRLMSVSEYYDETDNHKKGANNIKGDDYDKIMIDNEVISINKIDTITKKMLIKCGFLRQKSASNNTSLKKGNGKLMVTSGLTVKEFTKKYNV